MELSDWMQVQIGRYGKSLANIRTIWAEPEHLKVIRKKKQQTTVKRV